MHAGIDTHKDTLAVAVIDGAGRPVVVTELANTEAGFDALEKLRRIAYENEIGEPEQLDLYRELLAAE